MKRHINGAFDTEQETEADRLNMLITLEDLMATDVLVCTRDTEARVAARLPRSPTPHPTGLRPPRGPPLPTNGHGHHQRCTA